MTRRVRSYSRFRDGLALAIVVAVAVGVGWLYLRDEARQQTRGWTVADGDPEL
jgi:hypothetical protein